MLYPCCVEKSLTIWKTLAIKIYLLMEGHFKGILITFETSPPATPDVSAEPETSEPELCYLTRIC